MTLLRSHVEAAALAAYSLDELMKGVRTKNLAVLGELIPKTLFGTSMQKHREKPTVAGLLSAFEGDTIRACRAVEAMDRFYYQEHADGQLPIAYSLLCEFAHPNHRGVMHFMSTVERAGGWLISYGLQEQGDRASISKALEILLVSMRGGYAASQMLRLWSFAERNDELTWRSPDHDEAARIWEKILQRPISAA